MLVLTAPVDPTADYVIQHLNTAEVPLARVDSADFPVQLTTSATIKPGSPWAVTLGDINLDDVTAIYYRRPGRFVFSSEIPDPYLSWCEGQARYGFWGVLESLPARWVNHPRAVASAEYKPRQLAWANACGLTIPPTLVSNNPTAVALPDICIGQHGPAWEDLTISDSAGSTARLDRTDNGAVLVTETGPRALWNEVEHLHQQWHTWGRPHRERYGLTIHGENQTIWLDEPRDAPTWHLPAAQPDHTR